MVEQLLAIRAKVSNSNQFMSFELGLNMFDFVCIIWSYNYLRL